MRYFQSQLDVEADRLWDVEDTNPYKVRHRFRG